MFRIHHDTAQQTVIDRIKSIAYWGDASNNEDPAELHKGEMMSHMVAPTRNLINRLKMNDEVTYVAHKVK